MSRVGKHPILVPAGVTVEIANENLLARGKLGELSLPLNPLVVVSMENNQVSVRPRTEEKNARMMWGTYRMLVQNIVKGVSEGFQVNLEINGVGYRAAVQGSELVMQLGFSHEIRFAIPKGITIKCEKPTVVSVFGADRQLVGEVAAKIRSYRGPEPYKGKGIKYDNEVIVRKEGKKK